MKDLKNKIMATYYIEMNGAFVKEYRSLKKAFNWVFAKAKHAREKDYPGCLTIWEIKNKQKVCLLTNCI